MAVDAAMIEKTAADIIQGIQDHEALINGIAASVGILPAVAVAEKFLPLIAGLLQFLQQQNGKSLIDTAVDLANHVTPGKPEASALSSSFSGP